MAANITSSATILQSLSKVSYQLKWTGSTPIGTIEVQGSLDYSLDSFGHVSNAGTWTTLTVTYNGTSTNTIDITGNSGNGIIDLTTGIYALRLFYTATSGTGSLTAIVNGKVS